MSLDSTIRPMGMLATALFSASSTDMLPCSARARRLRSCRSVLVVPGWIQLTNIPSDAKESERFLAMFDTEALVTPLLLASVLAERAAMPPMLIILPPPRFCIRGITSLAQRIYPIILTLM